MKISNGFFVLYLSFGLILFACGGGSSGGSGGGSGDGSGGGSGGGSAGGSGGGGPASSNSTIRVSVDSDGNEATGGNSSAPSISSDGRYVVFESIASNLTSDDTNGAIKDIFVRDRNTNETTRVSVSYNGDPVNSASSAPSINSDSRYVAFESTATNLTSDDTNGVKDIFVQDRDTGTTSRVSVSSSGTQGNSTSSAPSISSDGRYVAFESTATNLTADDTNGAIKDIFVRDRNTNETTRVSVSYNGDPVNGASSAPSISSDGRYVAFESTANNLAADTNGVTDIFVYDRNAEITTRVSVSSSGIQGDIGSYSPSISSDGRYIAFESSATNLVLGDTNGAKDIFIYDRIEGITTRVSVDSSGIQGNRISSAPSISSDGRYVAFESYSDNLIDSDTNGVKDIFVHDRDTDSDGILDEPDAILNILVSVKTDGTQGNSNSYQPSISSDGLYVAFESIATNLVIDDTNGLKDIFVNGP
ncbi:MAG: PD40 domain-containing protein [Nitrospirae bacterium]|nr:PD40 domain-containing protein [Nitrospirota bacterium]